MLDQSDDEQDTNEITLTIVFVYYLMDKIYCDAYVKGLIHNTKLFQALSEEFYEDTEFKILKTAHISMGQSRVLPQSFTPGDKIMVRRRLHSFDPEDKIEKFRKVSKFEINSKTKSLVKEIISKEKPHFDIDLRSYYNISDDEEYDLKDNFQAMVTKCDKKTPGSTEINKEKPKKVIENNNVLSETSSPIQIQQKSVPDTMEVVSFKITEEMKKNLRVLKQINFISDHNHIIYKDLVLLKKPVGHAIGDWITDRDKIIHSEEFMLTTGLVRHKIYRFSRLNSRLFDLYENSQLLTN